VRHLIVSLRWKGHQFRIRLSGFVEFANNKNLFFYGTLKEDGECVIDIPRLKNMDEKEGKLVVEAIADSVYFKVYEAEVELKNSVEISMASQKTHTKPKMNVQLEGIAQKVVSEKSSSSVMPEEEVQNPFIPKEKSSVAESRNGRLVSFKDYSSQK
jgi:hypothetical protein